jgi:hypothetical protein
VSRLLRLLRAHDLIRKRQGTQPLLHDRERSNRHCRSPRHMSSALLQLRAQVLLHDDEVDDV